MTAAIYVAGTGLTLVVGVHARMHIGLNIIEYGDMATNLQYTMFDVEGTPTGRGWPLLAR